VNKAAHGSALLNLYNMSNLRGFFQHPIGLRAASFKRPLSSVDVSVCVCLQL